MYLLFIYVFSFIIKTDGEYFRPLEKIDCNKSYESNEYVTPNKFESLKIYFEA